MRILRALAIAAIAATPAAAQDPVKWSAAAPAARVQPGAAFEIAVTAAIDDEWHVYSVTQGPGGPVPTSISVGPRPLFSRAGAIRGPEPVVAFDPNFEIRTETYDGRAVLYVPVQLASKPAGPGATLRVAIQYQACTTRLCLPPATVQLAVPVQWAVEARGGLGVPATRPDVTASSPKPPAYPSSTVERPAPAESATPERPIAFGASAASWSAFIWLALSMGALSLLTPCVFPMVPITVAYFTNHAAPTRAGAIGSAAVYGAGIVLTFTAAGTVLAAIAGAAGLNRLAANPWLNLAITVLFIVFALSLFGVFELRVPASALTRLDRMSRRRGASVAGTLLMAATFTVTSLTCTAAFLGTLLVVAAQGEWQRPIVGLLAYSATFALPFVALAAAPQLASHLPRSGPWLARIKVVMGFLELAAAMKFLSNADLVWSWGIFTRVVVLIAWVGTALLLAGYLIRSRGGVGRLVGALAAVGCAAWLATGLAGRRLGELEAFLPPAAAPVSSELAWVTNDLDAALAQARASRRRVIVDFTGYTCTNCRWMEANMFPRPEVHVALAGFVRARLYTDGRGDVYERQQRFQQDQFGTVALPLYAILDADRRPIATFAGLTRDPREFLRFLASGR